MTPPLTVVLCLAERRGSVCPQVLCRIADDFTGTIEIKCPRCRTIHTRQYIQGVAHVA